ncbi:hypothetical protein EQP59_07080 [Ornithobacterium rhinotracheale]|uniref:Lipoprotein n=1 Tax=Ornithobacterium rhinotracheale TaxID=28251 RepID=A0A3R5XUV2_ORNRH|nr:hypothetical protein [Ornithobacterium rhinotracheale]QAR31110.1 hypothetical protein EQP59_07080 [Ornithobacterium rhinotracheale]
MKKVLLPLVAVVAFTFTSCEKKADQQPADAQAQVEPAEGAEAAAPEVAEVNADEAAAQKALEEAQKALEALKANGGDEAAVQAAEEQVAELQKKLDELKASQTAAPAEGEAAPEAVAQPEAPAAE